MRRTFSFSIVFFALIVSVPISSINKTINDVSNLPPLAPQAPQDLIPLTVTVSRIDAFCAPEASGQDFFAVGSIDDVEFSSRDHAIEDDDHVEPNWTFTYPVDENATDVPITLGVKDVDGGWPFEIDPDDRVDIHPDVGKTSLSITYNVTNGLWTVDMGAPGPAGDPPPARAGVWRGFLNPDCAEIQFDIGTGAFTADTDRDGLLDNWENFGIDYDGDGDVDIDLPAMGADPLVKDLFIEVDWMVKPNAPGAHTHEPLQSIWPPLFSTFYLGFHDQIKLHIDTGNLYQQPGGPAFDCDGDGISIVGDMDCDGDGIIDIGNLGALGFGTPGGGNPLTETQFLDFLGDGTPNDFYTVKAANFNPKRAPVFHYAVFGHDLSAASAGTSGRGEIFGNDFLVTLANRPSGFFSPYNALAVRGTQIQQAGTFMHELGHNLRLRHGGQDDENFKPIYTSVMNWDHQFGVVGLSVNLGLDYSYRYAFGDWFNENSLDECCTDTLTRCVYDSRSNVARVWTIGGLPAPQFSTAPWVDWNGDNLGVADDGDQCNTPNVAVETNFRFSGMNPSILTAWDDWDNIRLDFNHSLDYADGVPQEMVVEMTQAQENAIMAARPAVLRLFSPDQFCINHALINFDNLPAGTLVTNQYPGVLFVDEASVDPIVRNQAGRGGAATISMPNSLFGKPPQGSSSFGTPLTIRFNPPVIRVGMYIGNGGTLNPTAILRVYDQNQNFIGSVSGRTPENVNAFLGLVTLKQKIASLQLDYPISDGEEIDNLIFDACENPPQPPPTEPVSPFSFTARAESVQWIRENNENVDILVTELNGVPLTIQGVGRNTPYQGQAERFSNVTFSAPVFAIGPAGIRLVFQHWRMDEFLFFMNWQRDISFNIDHNLTITAVYYPAPNTFLPMIRRLW